MAGRLRGPRRDAATAGTAGEAVWGAAVRCLFDLRGDDEVADCVGTSDCRSRRADALRFREAEPAAGFEVIAESAGGGGSAASLAAERVILRDMRI